MGRPTAATTASRVIITRRTGSSAPHNNHPHHYNPRADETDYDDYETPEIGDIHGDEVYNNID
jgi:hypothetical protein